MTYSLLKTSKALGDETRLSIYHYLERPHKENVSVRHLARHFKLHPNAIRQHLTKLEEAGLVSSESLKPTSSGRPQRVYKLKGPVHGAELLPRDYKLLCEMLLELMVTSKIPIQEIKSFGRKWGERLVKTRLGKDREPFSPDEIARLLVGQFSGWGFEPKLAGLSDRRIDIRLQNCIFREVVEFHPDLVCPLLHGVLEGMLSPLIGHPNTTLQNGIAHGEQSCQVLVSLKPPA
jgi:predicted ArsR family transcriptional regulator